MPSLTELKQEARWRRYRRSAEQFIEECVYIQHPAGRRLLALREAQRETLREIQRNRRVIILKARQIGYTTLMGAYALWLCLFREDQNIVLLSKTERDAMDFLARIQFAYNLLPEWVKNRGPERSANTLQKMTFSNNSQIESLPSKEDPARGRTVTLVVIDEWASLENPENAWASIQPVADIGGSVIGLSTAKGWGDFFHTMWVRARTGASTFKPLFYSWRAVPDRDEHWYENAVRDLPFEWMRHQEYPENEDEAFIKSGRTVFDIDLLNSMPVEPGVRGDMWWSTEMRTREFRQNPSGYLEMWLPPKMGERYVIGADVAEGLEHGDYSSAHVVQVSTGEVVAHWHGHIPVDQFADYLGQLGRWYNQALLGVEVNASGLTVCTLLQRESYPRLYYRRETDTRTHNVTNRVGWYTSRATKPLIIDELAMELRNGGLVLKDEETIQELKTYVRDDKGGMGGSPHDDRTMSLAIANKMRQHVTAPEYVQDTGYQPGTMGWYIERELHTVERPEDAIGKHQIRKAA